MPPQSPHRIMEETLVLTSDSATATDYLKNQGGTVSLDMCRPAQEVIAQSELHAVSITARYILRKNILTDQLSRPDQILPMKWPLLRRVFDNICREFSCD